MGAKREMLLQLAKQRTCKPNFKGLRWIAKISSHIDTDVLHDAQAIQLLKAGALSQSDFEVLPAGYLATVHVDTSEVSSVDTSTSELEHSRTFADELLAHEQQLEELAEKPKRGRKAKQ